MPLLNPTPLTKVFLLFCRAASAEDYSVVYTHKSILTAFKEAGFTTIFLSNQTPNRSFTDFYFQEADHHQNIRCSPDGGMTTVNNFDEAMLPLLQHYVDSISGNLFVVLYTYGSHFNYKERYPEIFSLYEPDNVANVKVENKVQLINAYDNSIRYTDNFLYTLIGMLRKQEVISPCFIHPIMAKICWWIDENVFYILLRTLPFINCIFLCLYGFRKTTKGIFLKRSAMQYKISLNQLLQMRSFI